MVSVTYEMIFFFFFFLPPGNEGHGIHREVEEMCNAMLTVKPQRPLPPTLDSLNVAVATGILLHALQRDK